MGLGWEPKCGSKLEPNPKYQESGPHKKKIRIPVLFIGNCGNWESITTGIDMQNLNWYPAISGVTLNLRYRLVVCLHVCLLILTSFISTIPHTHTLSLYDLSSSGGCFTVSVKPNHYFSLYSKSHDSSDSLEPPIKVALCLFIFGVPFFAIVWFRWCRISCSLDGILGLRQSFRVVLSFTDILLAFVFLIQRKMKTVYSKL